MMKKYNLLPNDAIILASCRENKIKVLASYDSDFKTVCKNENIVLITGIWIKFLKCLINLLCPDIPETQIIENLESGFESFKEIMETLNGK